MEHVLIGYESPISLNQPDTAKTIDTDHSLSMRFYDTSNPRNQSQDLSVSEKCLKIVYI